MVCLVDHVSICSLSVPAQNTAVWNTGWLTLALIKIISWCSISGCVLRESSLLVMINEGAMMIYGLTETLHTHVEDKHTQYWCRLDITIHNNTSVSLTRERKGVNGKRQHITTFKDSGPSLKKGRQVYCTTYINLSNHLASHWELPGTP